VAKIIIGIHGLGNKPPKDLLEQWWKAAIIEGLNHIDKPHPFLKFKLIYWSDLLHPEPKDPQTDDPQNPLYIDEPYVPAEEWLEKETNQKRKIIQKFLEDQLDNIFVKSDGSPNFASISDKIVHHFFNDLEIYYSSESVNNSTELIREAIRERLFKILQKHKNKDILLIAHSMGSIISFDVLNGDLDSLKVNSFATIGSPLGLPNIKAKLKKKTDNQKTLSVPKNIKKHWHNFSDLEDKVAINYDLADDYLPNENGIGITDFEVKNNYKINNLSNPHKSYGYLRTPEMANVIDQFLIEGKSKFSVWIIRKINNFFKKQKGN